MNMLIKHKHVFMQTAYTSKGFMSLKAAASKDIVYVSVCHIMKNMTRVLPGWAK